MTPFSASASPSRLARWFVLAGAWTASAMAGPTTKPVTGATTKPAAMAGMAGAAPGAGAAGHWEGAIKLPALPLVVYVDLLQKPDGLWTGSIDIPQQHARHLALDPVAVAGSAVRFTIADVPGEPTFDGKLTGGKIDGTFKQSGLGVPFELGREHYVAAPAGPSATRPRETPLDAPYRSEDVSYDRGPIHLAATLTLPPGNGPFPAVVLITGSGPQNRDEEIFGHKPFLVLADDLTRAGIAVLRADDRGVGGSTGGSVADSTTEELAGDTVAGVNYLLTRREIDHSRIGLIGHSEGAIIAALIASRDKDIKFIVMLAGTGVPGDQVIERQSALLHHAAGESDAAVQTETADLQALLKAIERGESDAALRPPLRTLVTDQLTAANPTTRPNQSAIDQTVDMSMRQLTSRWFRYFLTFDPSEALRKLKVPVLVLNGSKDLQVDPDQNLPAVASALAASGDLDVTILRLPGLNHLFQAANTGSITEYESIPESIDPAAVKVIREWVLKRVGNQTATPAAHQMGSSTGNPAVNPAAHPVAHPAASQASDQTAN